MNSIDFDKCPNCGSTELIAQSVADEEIEKGNLRKDAKFPFLAHKVPVFDVSSKLAILPRTVTMLFGLFDVCANCGTFFCVHAETGEGRISAEYKSSPGGPGGPGDSPPGFAR